MERDPEDRNSYGVLVGWTHAEFADKLDLRLQTVPNAEALQRDQVESLHIVMTPQQATLLANYLFTVTGQSPPRPPKRSLIGRWFGS
jgi:hypothetical protein